MSDKFSSIKWRYSKIYKSWNFTTACCFKFKTHCVDCPNRIVCELYANASKNVYKIHPVKFATLMTYSNIGIEGLEEELIRGFKKIEADNKIFMRQEYWRL